jgi:hypothetical protein
MGTRSKLAWAGGFFMGTGAMQATALTLPHNLMACHEIVHAQLEKKTTDIYKRARANYKEDVGKINATRSIKPIHQAK